MWAAPDLTDPRYSAGDAVSNTPALSPGDLLTAILDGMSARVNIDFFLKSALHCVESSTLS